MMPTSSEKLKARAAACLKTCNWANKQAEDSDDVLEAEAFYRIGKLNWMEHLRYRKLALEREEKEKDLPHRRTV
jgi:hypothetical protein